METEKENIARDHNQSREVYAKGSGISTGDAQKFLADLADPTNIPNVKTPYAITAKPSKLRAFVTKLKNAREFVDVEVKSNAVDSWRDPTRGFHGLYRKGGDVGGRKSRKLGNKFNRCVKSVRSTVRARKGSNKESAAIAICTTSVLHPRGRTIKRYRKKRLVTQRKFRGGGDGWAAAKALKDALSGVKDPLGGNKVTITRESLGLTEEQLSDATIYITGKIDVKRATKSMFQKVVAVGKRAVGANDSGELKQFLEDLAAPGEAVEDDMSLPSIKQTLDKYVPDKENEFDFPVQSSKKMDITNPATAVSLKTIREESYGDTDGFAKRAAADIEAAHLAKLGMPLNPEERGVGGKKTRRRSKKTTRRR